MKSFLRDRQTWKRWAPVVIVIGAVLAWLSPSRARPAGRGPLEEPVAAPIQRPVGDERLLPSGGPYIDSDRAAAVAFGLAREHGIAAPRGRSMRLMTYDEAVRENRMGRNVRMDPNREVYLISLDGAVTIIRRHGSRSFTRTFYVIDATTGDIIDWGATNNPDPEAPSPARN